MHEVGALATAPAASAADVVGMPGQNNAITDVPGIHVGQVQSDTAPYLTGTTVVHTPTMSVVSVDQRGGAPATKETDLFSPLNSNPGVNAIQLGGSSMYGLSATNGIIRWLEDRGEGVFLGPAGVAPIVPAADIYDLNRAVIPRLVRRRSGVTWPPRRPPMGRSARAASGAAPVPGVVACAVARGVGTASVYLGGGIHVGALVIVNPAGSPVNPADCTLWGIQFGLGDEFDGYRTPEQTECPGGTVSGLAQKAESLNTTIAVVATNAPLEKAAAQRMSGNAHDGMARAINPIHTLADGDTVFAVSTGQGEPLQVNDPADSRQLNAIFGAGATTLARAIAKAMLAAESHGARLSYCDTYPSACADMPQLEEWRTAGEAPDVTPASFNRASKALKQTPVPQPRSGQEASSDPERDEAVAPLAGGGPRGDGSVAVGAVGEAAAVTAGLAAMTALAALTGLAVARRRPQRLLLR